MIVPDHVTDSSSPMLPRSRSVFNYIRRPSALSAYTYLLYTATLIRFTNVTARSRNLFSRKMNADNAGNLCLYTSATATGRPGWVEHFESQLRDHPSAKCTCGHS